MSVSGYTGTVNIAPVTQEEVEARRRARNPYSKEGNRDIIIGDPFQYEGQKYLGIGSIDPHPSGGAWVRVYDVYGDPVSEAVLTERYGTEGKNEVNRLAARGVEKMLNYLTELIRNAEVK